MMRLNTWAKWDHMDEMIIWNYMAMWMQFDDIAEIMSPIGLCG
jgi:hypothetical protein